jgi:alpha-tubulin suppressor-like RCC1 family protein
VDSVAAGLFHGAAASSTGDVFVWGLGVNGQLGLGDGSDYLAPQQLPELVRLLATGTAHTLFGVEVE